jgi:hypothetical protein
LDPDHVDRQSSVARIRLLAERLEERGAYHLTAGLLDAVQHFLPENGLNCGRVLFQRGRVSRKLSDVALAEARYARVERFGRRLGSPELMIRAQLGHATMAFTRGNYPALRDLSQQIVDLGEPRGYSRLISEGYHGLMVATAQFGQLDVAMRHAWRVYELRRGSPTAKASALLALGKLLLEGGHPGLSRNLFATVLASRPPATIGIVALGGFALACARTDDSVAVRWAAAQASSYSEQGALRYEIASTLLDCTDALEFVDESAYAAVLRARAMDIAQRRGFHEIVMKLEAGSAAKPAAPASTFDPPSEVAFELGALPVARVPDFLELAAV